MGSLKAFKPVLTMVYFEQIETRHLTCAFIQCSLGKVQARRFGAG